MVLGLPDTFRHVLINFLHQCPAGELHGAELATRRKYVKALAIRFCQEHAVSNEGATHSPTVAEGAGQDANAMPDRVWLPLMSAVEIYA